MENKTQIFVQTPLGRIRGSIMSTRKNQHFFAFRGIRYAEPPVGDKRFKPPVPMGPWIGTLDATKDGFICPQPTPFSNIKELTSEDCLSLNVYAKRLSDSLPVIVYIHGGIFETGGSHSELFWGPQYLMDKDIVFVIMNYRLGPLGFLSTGTEDAPGNYGFKDQVMALRWIQDNIKAFGGDPNRVTLAGHSSGATCVTLHMVSPMSKDLFHRVIVMSGSCTSHTRPDNQKLTKLIAQKLGCPIDSPKILIENLRKVPCKDLVEAYTCRTDSFIIKSTWGYEIEADYGQEQFMSDDPINLYVRGIFSRVPVLAGFTKHENGQIDYKLKNNSELVDEFNKDFNSIAPEAFKYDASLTHISESLKSAYLHDEPITWRNMNKFGEICADSVIMHAMHRFVALTRQLTSVYYYRQDYVGRYSWYYDSDGKPFGVSHCDDLLYLFVHKRRAPMFKEEDPENFMVERLTELWTTFARTGNPNNKNSRWTNEINWEPSNKDNLRMLYINEECNLSGESYQNRFKLWDTLFPIAYLS